MSGLDPDRERILEIAIILTDCNLQTIAELPNMVISQDESLLQNMDEWNSTQHRKTGLYDEVLASTTSENQAESTMLEMLREHLSAKDSPMCGNSVHQDRRFLRRYMPELHDFFHYRNLDVSTLRSLAKYWHPNLLRQRDVPPSDHRARSDILGCIDELAFYRSHFIQVP